MNEPRTIEEQYTSAGNADDLTVTSERRTDADVLIASGWTPEPVTLPTMRRGVAILQLVAAGADTNRAVASRLWMKLTDSVAGPIAALDREGYIARTRNDGRSDRVLSLTDRGRRALEIANAG